MAVELALALGVGVVLVLPIGARGVQRRLDPFEPYLLFAVAWAAMFVVRPLAMLARDDLVFFGVNIEPTLARALLLAFVGAVGFVVGYQCRVGGLVAGLAPRPRHVEPRRLMIGATALSALGVLALCALLAPGGWASLRILAKGRSSELNDVIADSTTYLWWASLLVLPGAIIAYATAWIAPKRARIALAVLLVALAVIRVVPVGTRAYVLPLVGSMLVFPYLARQRRPRPTTLVIWAVMAIVVSWGTVSLRYADDRDVQAVLEGVGRTPERIVAPITRGADAEMLPALAGALTVVPSELGHSYGKATIGEMIVRPVPREWWAGKPETPGHQVVEEVWPVARERGGFDPAFTPLLPLFWDFGLVGVFLGMGWFGAMARALSAYLATHADMMVAQLVFAVGIWFVVAGARFDPVSVVVQGAVIMLPLLLVLIYSSQPETAGRRLGP